LVVGFATAVSRYLAAPRGGLGLAVALQEVAHALGRALAAALPETGVFSVVKPTKTHDTGYIFIPSLVYLELKSLVCMYVVCLLSLFYAH
jgi:hypothetical protein